MKTFLVTGAALALLSIAAPASATIFGGDTHNTTNHNGGQGGAGGKGGEGGTGIGFGGEANQAQGQGQLQGQLQGQAQGQGQGQAQNATAQQGQSQSQATQVGQANEQSLSVGGQSMGSQSVTLNTPKAFRAAPDVAAPVVVNVASCAIGSGVSLSVPGGGGNFTHSRIDPNCDARADAAMWLSLGLRDVAINRMYGLKNDAAYDAFMARQPAH